jgi:hypothetical protein
MDMEANLMSEEERKSVSIHTTCRTNFNDLRKQLKSAEDLTDTQNKKKQSAEYMTEKEDPELGKMGSDSDYVYNEKKNAQQGFEINDRGSESTRESLMNGNFNDLQD